MKAEIFHASENFRRGDKHIAWLASFLVTKGFDPTRGILASLATVPDQFGVVVGGVWVTDKRDFWEVEAVTDPDSGQLINVERFENITSSMPIEAHLKGQGKSFGFLAFEALREVLEANSSFNPDAPARRST